MRIFVFSLLLWLSLTNPLQAQEVYQELKDIIRAEVLEVTAEREERIMGTSASTTVQSLRVELTEGSKSGEVVEFENDMVQLVAGDKIFVSHVVNINGDEYYYLKDVDRNHILLLLAGLFVLLLLVFAGWHGVRALLSLAFSILAILFLLVPAMLAGHDPILVSLGIAGVILAIVLFGTHGFNVRSYTAFAGTFGAVLLTSIVAFFFVQGMRLTGFGTDASVYLNFATEGQLDFAGLLLGSIIIGILGILDDVSITQASVVQELKVANNNLTVFELYKRAIRVGRDHVGSLVNTLALAYVGAALPLVLLFSTSEAGIALTLNQEVVAAELARIIIGSIGLILAVPLTTIMAAWWIGTHGSGDISTHSHGHHHH